MAKPDLNLLFALEALLAEGSVARAARRLRLSPSATSRTLARLRKVTGDPLLVRAGRGLVATPLALELRGRVTELVAQAQAVLQPARKLELATLVRTFTLRTSEGFVETFGPALIAHIARSAPKVRLRFATKAERDSDPLREGTADLEIGVVGQATGPELRTQLLFRDRWIGVVRQGHRLGKGRITPARYAAENHVLVSRRESRRSPIDDALERIGLAREITTVVGSYSTALALARASDLVASVPERLTEQQRSRLTGFALPIATPALAISMIWHPRQDADLAHGWLRERLREICR